MSFLNKIDEVHNEVKTANGIELSNTDFSSFISVEPVDISLSKKFVILKQKKSKLLIVSGKQRVYLSDYHIVSTILRMDKSYVDWFLKELIKAYKDEYKPFKITINGEEFEGSGISYYTGSCKILLFSDTEVDINDFIFVINFVLFKDKQWEIDSEQENFRRKTIVKYITLIDYYANKAERSMEFLYRIGYNTATTHLNPFFDDEALALEIDSFDISKYL